MHFGYCSLQTWLSAHQLLTMFGKPIYKRQYKVLSLLLWGHLPMKMPAFSSLPSPLLLSFFLFFFLFPRCFCWLLCWFFGNKKASLLCAKVIISRLTISNLSVLLVQLSSFSYETKGIVLRIIFLLQVFSFILIKIHSRSTILHENRDHS